MLNVIKRAMIKRQAILISKYQIQSLTPNNIDFIKGSWLNINAWKGNDTPNATMPSFIRGWRAARKHYFTFGLETVAPPAYGHSSDIESFDSY
jgi:hypothetical protein